MPTTLTVAAVDQTAKIMWGSLSCKLNTLDFTLVDPATRPAIGDAAVLAGPAWSGTVTALETSDPVDRVGHVLVKVTAANTAVPTASAAPFGLSDAPDGSTTYGYRGLRVQTTRNLDGTTTIHGSCAVQQAGLWPAMTFVLTSANQGLSAYGFTVTNVTVAWPTSAVPSYAVEFGDPIVTMAVWTASQAGAAPAGSIDGTRITSGTVDTPQLRANSITAPLISAGAVTAGKIAAGAVTADKLSVGDGFGPNLQPNGSFQLGWSLIAGMPWAGWSTSPYLSSANGLSDNYCLRAAVTGPSTEGYIGLGDIVLDQGGRTVTWSAWMRNASGGGSPLGRVMFLARRAATAVGSYDYAYDASANLPDSGAWVRIVGTQALPADAVAGFVRPGWVNNAGVAGGWQQQCDIEDVQVEYGPTATQYKPSAALRGNVIIDSSGITVMNGKLTLSDQYGASVMAASGFSGDWSDFISNGLYNSRFLHGAAGTIPDGVTPALPYWNASSSSATLTYFDSGVQCAWSALAGVGRIFGAAVPVLDTQWYTVNWSCAINRAAGGVRITPYVYWYDEAMTQIGLSTLSGITSTASLSQVEGPQDSAPAPPTARYAVVWFGLDQVTTHSASNWAKLYGVAFRPGVQAVGPARFSDVATVRVDCAGTYARFSTGTSMDVVSLIEAAPSSAVTIYGLRSPTISKRLVTVVNQSNTYAVTLKHESASATYAEDRINTPGSADCVISAYGGATLYYNWVFRRWQVLSKS